ncbi:unnamed protein product, partial [Prorocentrum cordatum]
GFKRWLENNCLPREACTQGAPTARRAALWPRRSPCCLPQALRSAPPARPSPLAAASWAPPPRAPPRAPTCAPRAAPRRSARARRPGAARRPAARAGSPPWRRARCSRPRPRARPRGAPRGGGGEARQGEEGKEGIRDRVHPPPRGRRDLLESPKFPMFMGGTNGYMSKGTRERHAITWTAKEAFVFEMPILGVAVMNKGENLCYFRKKEQCIALGKQLRKMKIENYKIYRLKKDGQGTAPSSSCTRPTACSPKR